MSNWSEVRFGRRTFGKMLGLAPFTQEPLIALVQERERVITSSVLTFHEVNARGMAAEILGLIWQGFTPLSLDIFVQALKGEVEIPQSMPTFLVTCDDGLASQYIEGLRAVDAVQRESGVFVPLVFFVMPRFDGYQLPIEEIPDNAFAFNDRAHRYMTKGQMIELIQTGHYVQSHTIDHKPIASLSPASLRDNIMYAEQRIDALWEIAGRERQVRAFAYPYGNHDAIVAQYLEDRGYDVAFTTMKATQHSSHRRMILGRIGKT